MPNQRGLSQEVYQMEQDEQDDISALGWNLNYTIDPHWGGGDHLVP